MVDFPFGGDREQYGDVRTIAERAGIELRGEDGQPFCCDSRMHTKEGLMGPDYAKCSMCGTTMLNLASPHVNGGFLLNDDIMDEYGNVIWTYTKETK